MTTMSLRAEEFRQVRRELELTQSEMARLLGVSTKAVQSYEQGWRVPPEPIRRLLGIVSVSYQLWLRKEKAARSGSRRFDPQLCKEYRQFLMRQGRLCWLVIRTDCTGLVFRNGSKNPAVCEKCRAYRLAVESTNGHKRGLAKSPVRYAAAAVSA